MERDWPGKFAPVRPHRDAFLFCGDSLELLTDFPAESIDLIFADPPYFLSDGGITCKSGRMAPVDKGSWDRPLGTDETHRFNLRWLELCRRVLKPHGTIWVSGTSHNIHSVGFAMLELGFKLLNEIVWVKPNPPPNLSCRYFTHASELILWAARSSASKHRFNYAAMKQQAGGRQMSNVWEILPPRKGEKAFGKHPTQKPVELLKRIVAAASLPEDWVLDPFQGSGTTGVAALSLERRYLGIERDPHYAEMAAKRIAAVAPRLPLSAER